MKDKKYFLCTVTFKDGQYIQFPALTYTVAKSMAKDLGLAMLAMTLTQATDVDVQECSHAPGTIEWPLRCGTIEAHPVPGTVEGAGGMSTAPDDVWGEKMKEKLMYAMLWATKQERAVEQDPRDKNHAELAEAYRVLTYLLSELHKADYTGIEDTLPFSRYRDVVRRASTALSIDYYATDCADEDDDAIQEREEQRIRRKYDISEQEKRDFRAHQGGLFLTPQEQEDARQRVTVKRAQRMAMSATPTEANDVAARLRAEDNFYSTLKMWDDFRSHEYTPGTDGARRMAAIEARNALVRAGGDPYAPMFTRYAHLLYDESTMPTEVKRNVDLLMRLDSDAAARKSEARLARLEAEDNAARARIKNLNRENVADAKRHLSTPVKRSKPFPISFEGETPVPGEEATPRGYTYSQHTRGHYGIRSNRLCVIPDQVVNDQKAYEGRTFPVKLLNGDYVRAILHGDDYGLYSGGTGDIVVRPA